MAALSDTLDKQCEFHVFLRIHLGYIATDSSLVVNTLYISESLHYNIVHHRRAFPKRFKLQRQYIGRYPCGIFSTTVRLPLYIIPPPFLVLKVSPFRNVSGSTETLPEHATDRFVYAQRLESAQQPESGPIHPLLPFSSEIPSHEFITPDSSGSERPHPKAYANQTPADNLSLNRNASRNLFFRRSPGPGSIYSTSTAASSTVTLTPSIMTFASSTPTLVNTSRSTQPHPRVGSVGKSRGPISRVDSEAPLVILRVRVISCSNLEAGRNGYSDPCVRSLIILFASVC